MHALFIHVTVNDPDAATNHLRDNIVPLVTQAPGFVSGSWVRIDGGNKGRATIIFESEEAARALADQIQPAPDNATKIDGMEFGEVVERA